MSANAFHVDDSQLRSLDRRLSRTGKVFDKPTVKRVLRQALKPTLAAVRVNAPTGPKRTYKSLVRTRGSRKGTPRPSYEARRGGFTRRDARILIVEGKGNEIARGLVGISQKGDKVGFRTHLITRANLRNRTANDFLRRAERQTEGQPQQNFLAQAEVLVQRSLAS